MAVTYHFDLYPRTNPSGVRLVRFTNLQAAEYRGEANGSGAGRFSIRATDAEAAFIDPDGLQYVRVVRDNGATELVVGGFFLESGEYAALTETSTKLLSYGGAGTLSYLGRGVMDADSWLDDPFIGTDPQPDGTWPVHRFGTNFPGGPFNQLGAILWRVLHELEEPGRHQDPVPLMTLGFTYLVDSNAASWVRTTGDFVVQVGDGILPIIRRLMQLGLYVEVDPNTFEVNAYEPGTHRRDRTGVAWGTNIVRFQSPTDGTVATGNIKSDAKRALEAKIRRNAILVGSNDTWEWVDDPGVTVLWEGGYILDDEDGASLADAGAAQLAARSDAGDVLRLRFKLGESPTTGTYLPFEHVRLDDLVTVHTGTGQWDYDEAEFPVAALTVSLRPGGDWDAWADLGSTHLSMHERAFEAQPVKAHTHPPNPKICRDSASIARLGRTETGTSVSNTMEWDDPAEPSFTTPQTVTVKCRWSDLDTGVSDRSVIEFAMDGADALTSYLTIQPGSPASDVWWNADESDALSLTGINLANWVWIKVENDPDYIQAKIWQDGTAEPGAWGARAERPLGNTDDVTGGRFWRFVNNWAFNQGAWMWQFGSFIVTEYSPSQDAFLRSSASGWGTSPAAIPWTWSAVGVADIIAADSCIHGGLHAFTGDTAESCSKCVAAGNHEHDYVAAGGTAGQLLAKASATDWDTEWISDAAAAHVIDTSDAHDASAISILDTANDFTATDVEGALAELQSDAEAHLADATDAHDASAISVLDVAGNFTATEVEGVLAELDSAIAAGGIPATIVDVKGDLIAATAADTVSRLAAGADGEVLTADSGASTGLSWAASGGSAREISRTQSIIQDECFFQGNAVSSYNGGFGQSISGTGATIINATGEANHPGVIQLTTGTTTTGRVAFFQLNSNLISILLGGGETTFLTIFKIDALSDGTETYACRSGFGDSVTGDPTDGVFFRYTHSVNSGKWEIVARSNATETAADSGITADTNWHSFECIINAAGTSAEFFIDGTSVGTTASNIPTGTGRELIALGLAVVKSAGTTARTFKFDAYRYTFDFTTPR